MITTNPPIIVVVANGRYDLYGPDTAWSDFLAKQIQLMGGINENVEDGCYHFNINEAFVGVLTPFEE